MIADLWVVLTVVGFFAVCVAFVRGCDRIIGPDDAVYPDDQHEELGADEAAVREVVR